MGVRWGSVRSPLGVLGSLGSPLGVLGTSRGPRVELEGLLVGLLVGVFGCFFGASSGLLGGLWVPVGALRGGSLVCIVYKTRRVATTMNEKESSLESRESRRQDTHHPRVGGFDGQTLTDICLEVDLKSYNKYLPAGHRHRAPKFSLQNLTDAFLFVFRCSGPAPSRAPPQT